MPCHDPIVRAPRLPPPDAAAHRLLRWRARRRLFAEEAQLKGRLRAAEARAADLAQRLDALQQAGVDAGTPARLQQLQQQAASALEAKQAAEAAAQQAQQRVRELRRELDDAADALQAARRDAAKELQAAQTQVRRTRWPAERVDARRRHHHGSATPGRRHARAVQPRCAAQGAHTAP